jgi:hypothetical protein
MERTTDAATAKQVAMQIEQVLSTQSQGWNHDVVEQLNPILTKAGIKQNDAFAKQVSAQLEKDGFLPDLVIAEFEPGSQLLDDVKGNHGISKDKLQSIADGKVVNDHQYGATDALLAGAFADRYDGIKWLDPTIHEGKHDAVDTLKEFNPFSVPAQDRDIATLRDLQTWAGDHVKGANSEVDAHDKELCDLRPQVENLLAQSSDEGSSNSVLRNLAQGKSVTKADIDKSLNTDKASPGSLAPAQKDALQYLSDHFDQIPSIAENNKQYGIDGGAKDAIDNQSLGFYADSFGTNFDLAIEHQKLLVQASAPAQEPELDTDKDTQTTSTPSCNS